MIEHSKSEDPNECCGILAGTNGNISKLYKIRNASPSPYRYVMDPQEMLTSIQDADENGIDLVAFYHSHTHSPAYPSETDTRMAVESGWVDFCYVLVSLEDEDKPVVRFYVIDSDGEVLEEETQILA
jgi:proteasome lid subunit RPN8/RPN11|tara:strand:- start:41 stop:421 length:381 start_codon:yes stop_codon:yes gene_type:complete